MPDDVIYELSRRGVIKAGIGSLGLASISGGSLAQVAEVDKTVLQDAAFLLGTGPENPNDVPELAPDGPFFGGDDWTKTRYAYIYQTPSGAQYRITQALDAWDPLGHTNFKVVNDSSDLPAATNGTHTLENKVYWFDGFVTSPYGLDISNSPTLLGRHGANDGFIHTGQATAITGTNGGFYARNAYFHAPGGTLFDLTADQTTEMLVESCAFSDAAGIGQIASLGTITGYRVPTFKGVNIEDFAGGLTFDGEPDKILISNTPLRTVTATGVQILQFAPTLNVDIVQLKGNYVKEVQSDTEVVYVDPSATITDVFQYVNNTHDSSVSESNILTGAAAVRAIGYRVNESYPLPDSGVAGELDLNTLTTVTGSGASPTQITGPTTLSNPERVSMPADGVLQYDGQKTVKEVVNANVIVSGANTEFSVWMAKNGSIISRTETLGFLPNASNPVGVVAVATLSLETGDELSLYLENTGGSADLDVEKLALTV